MKLLITISLLTWLLSIDLVAQHVKCGTHEDYSQAKKADIKSYPRTILEIPIVFHVVWRRNADNIDDRLIFSQLTTINQDFSAQNPDLTLVPEEFKKYIGNAGLSFCLANTDGQGSPSSGIVRTRTSLVNIGNESNVLGDGERIIMKSAAGGSDAWDPEKFLNVWVGARDDGILGDASFPNTGEGTMGADGIVIDYRAIGKNNSGMSFNLGRTLTHEIGHYLNVFHLSGSEGGCFNEGDFVDDTPAQFSEYFGPCVNPVSSCTNRDMDMNFMNFRDDACLVFFTKGQVERMRESLFSSRNGLINSNTCSSNNPIPDDPLKIARLRTLQDRIELSLTTLVKREYTLSVYDVSGREVMTMSETPSHIYDFPFSTFNSGVYVIRLQLEGKQWLRKVYID